MIALATEYLKIFLIKCEVRIKRTRIDVVNLEGVSYRPGVAATFAMVPSARYYLVSQLDPLIR